MRFLGAIFTCLLCWIWTAHAIYQGQMAEQDEFGASVALTTNRQNFLENGLAFCSGTLINSDTILTAAHCVVSIKKARDIIVSFGSTVSSDAVLRRAAKITIHPEFLSATGPNPYFDIALIQLESPAPTEIQPAELISPNYPLRSFVRAEMTESLPVESYNALATPAKLVGFGARLLPRSQTSSRYHTNSRLGFSTAGETPLALIFEFDREIGMISLEDHLSLKKQEQLPSCKKLTTAGALPGDSGGSVYITGTGLQLFAVIVSGSAFEPEDLKCGMINRAIPVEPFLGWISQNIEK